MLHIPILRRGEPYRSLDAARAVNYRTREPFVEVSQANVGLIRRDLREQAEAREILERTGRGMMFGDASSVGAWKDDPRIELHGPGYSKIVIGEDCADEWEKHIDVIARSVAENGGRSCVNASGIWVTRHAEEIAEALAERLSRIVPRAEDDPDALLAPFADPTVAERINGMVEGSLSEPGARDVTARLRGGERLARREGCAYLLPTVVHCETADHPLANREFLFPFTSVVAVRQEEI